jgi:hypothetical protein
MATVEELTIRLDKAEAREREIREAPETAAQIRAELDRESMRKAEAQAAADADYEVALRNYEVTKRDGLAAESRAVECIQRAAERRRQLKDAARRAKKPIPESVNASIARAENKPLRDLRQELRKALQLDW